MKFMINITLSFLIGWFALDILSGAVKIVKSKQNKTNE